MRTVLDTGPLVAMLNRRDAHHGWAVGHASDLDAPFHSCEAVISEAHFLLRGTHLGGRRLDRIVESGRLDLSFSYEDHVQSVNALMRKYDNIPMSFADGCVVRLAEIHSKSRVFTVDRDFLVYRKNGNERIDVMLP